MAMNLTTKNCNGIGEISILTKSDYHKKLLRNELQTVKSIKIPTQNYSITNTDLANWIIEVLSPKEIEELLSVIKVAKKRSKNIKPLLATFAIGLINREY